jgi:plasmid stabilization system protein ParE
MEEKVVISKRFRNNTLQIYQYLLKEFSAKTAHLFLDRLEKRIGFIANNPTVGKLSSKRQNIRSVLFTPHNQIFYRYNKNKVEILCLFDMRKDPKRKPY